MKKLQKVSSLIRGLTVGMAVVGCLSTAKASPYASGITNIVLGGSNYVQFVINESGAAVSYVTFPSGASNVLSANCPVGVTNFYLGATDTSFKIYCYKQGNGTPAQITVDTNSHGFNYWPYPRGIDINKNPTNGALFGRIYVGNGYPAANGTPVSFAKGNGVYTLKADCSDSYLGMGTNAYNPSDTLNPTGIFQGLADDDSPWSLSVNPNDNTIDLADYSAGNAAIYKIDPNFQPLPNYVVLAPIGQSQGITAGVHSDPSGAFTTGSIATSNLVLYTFDPDLGEPGSAAEGLGNEGLTTPGQFNDLFRYDIGAGPLPWTNVANSGVCLGLPGFNDSQNGSPTLGPDLGSNYLYGQFYRANGSDPCIQVFTNNGGTYNIIYSSFINGGGTPANDVFATAYAQSRVSPDGLYLAAITVDNVILVVNLTNGVPDNSTILTIANTSAASHPDGLAFDAGDNVYEVSQGQGLLRGYSLGNTATAITGNDITGTNGTFQLELPTAVATIVTTQNASQNYINNSSPGTPIPGIFTITLTSTNNPVPVPVNIAITGTATNGAAPAGNYTLNTNDANGVTYSKTLVTFPAGPSPGGTNWTAHLIVTPTASPLSGPTFSVTVTMSGGGTYRAGSPKIATMSIANTGPQYLFLGTTTGNTMNRGIPDDYARFTVTRWGDTNGPGNSPGSVVPSDYTITNVTYTGTASFASGNDYLAQVQRADPTGNGVVQLPTAGSPGIKVYRGNTAITCVVGDPVRRPSPLTLPTNVTIIVNLETAVPAGGTNGTSVEGSNYNVGTGTVTLTEVDNNKGAETVLWVDPLTNSVDHGWNLTYGSTNMGTNTYTILPALVTNYTNTETQMNNGGTNDFEVLFGHPISADSVPQSPLMAASNWTTALRMTVNKDGNNAPAAVNLYPQGSNFNYFNGNVALRFSMYLSTFQYAQAEGGTKGREFALFGVDNMGTNLNWRPTLAVLDGTGVGVTNNDGQWIAVDAGTGSLTPADYDGFNAPPLPNSPDDDGNTDIVSNPNTAETGIFKNPPFTDSMSLSGGSPDNLWVDVDLEKAQTSTNLSLFTINTYIDRASVLTAFQTSDMPQNGQPAGDYTNGTVMLGYEDPVYDVSDNTAFVYYSNVRVVELSPFLSVSPLSRIVLAGSNVVLSASATYSYSAVPSMTNTWMRGTTTPATAVQVDTVASTNMTDTLTVNTTTGSNYWAVFSDFAGAITSYVASIEVITGPSNVTANAGANAQFTVTATGSAAPGYQWQTNGHSIANGTKYTNVTTATLTVSNCQASDALVTYDVVCTNTATNYLGTTSAQSVTTKGATLTLNSTVAPSGAVVSPASQTNLWGSSATFTVTVGTGTPPYTYGWKANGTNLYNPAKYSGTNTNTLTISNLTQADATNYTVGVTNSAGNTLSSAGVLVVVVPPPHFSAGGVKVSGGNVTMNFTSTNSFDTSNAFILLSSPVASAPANAWTNTTATFSGSAESFQVVVPESSTSNMFYQLEHVN